MIGTALILHPVLTGLSKVVRGDDNAAMTEICGLAQAIDLDILDAMPVNVSRIQAGYFFGKGAREHISQTVESLSPDIVIVNHILSPVQQRNLEKDFNAKVIDRTGLILEIFGARAQTKEGRIQVELAQLDYQKSRLVKSWSHLERQRGGSGFLGGPGESQLELDRRQIAGRIANLKKELEKVRKTRDLSRKARERVPFPVIVLVGYTNAGKSTLFNRLTGAQVFAKDLLFATLDPTMRRLTLPSGRMVILSDTVGFISDLPTHLIEAFKATLEQTQYAAMILHVRDTAQADYEKHQRDVITILEGLGIEYDQDERLFEVMNKIDSCTPVRREDILRSAAFDERIIPVSAVTGEGIETLLQTVDEFLSRHWQDIAYDIPKTDGKAMAWLYQHADVIKTQEEGDNLSFFVHIDPVKQQQFESLFPYEVHSA